MYVALLLDIGLSYEEIATTTYKEQRNLVMGHNKLQEVRKQKANQN